MVTSLLALGLFYNVGGSTANIAQAKSVEPIEYACTVDGSTIIPPDVNIKMMVTPHMDLPEQVKPNGKITGTNVSADIDVDLTGILNDLRGLINPFKGHANIFNVEANGQTKNAVGKKGSPFPETPHADGDEWIPFNVPGIDTTFTAGKEDVEVHVGNINADIISSLATLTVTCVPQGDTLVATVKVGDEGTGDGEEPIESDKSVEVTLGAEAVEIQEGVKEVKITSSNASIKLPEDLPEGTKVSIKSVEDLPPIDESLEQAGDVYEIIFDYPEGEDYTGGGFVLTLGASSSFKNVAIYHYDETNEAWEKIGGKVEGNQISTTVEHFSTYGVFGEKLVGGNWFTGKGEPANDLGENNDLYLNETNFDIYKKEDGAWRHIGDLKGEAGKPGENGAAGIPGATWLVGEGAPGQDDGRGGDLYLDTKSGDVYLKSADGWVKVANIKGDDGEGKGEGKKESGDNDTEKNGKTTTAVDNGKGGPGEGETTKSTGHTLPKTATDNPLIILYGASFTLLGGLMAFIRRKIVS